MVWVITGSDGTTTLQVTPLNVQIVHAQVNKIYDAPSQPIVVHIGYRPIQLRFDCYLSKSDLATLQTLLNNLPWTLSTDTPEYNGTYIPNSVQPERRGGWADLIHVTFDLLKLDESTSIIL